MNHYIPLELIRGYEDTVQNLQILRENLKKYPDGWIEHKRKGRKSYPYYRYYDEYGKKRSKKIEDVEVLQEAMDDRNALRVQMNHYKKVQEQYEHALKYFNVDVDHLEQEAQRKREELMEADQQYLEELARVQKKKYSDQYKYCTISGIRVMSKSEMMVSDALTRRGIRHDYEKPIIINGHKLKPDFTIYFRNKIYYWEHLGLMDDKSYRDSWYWKKEQYKQAGIEEGINLIVSMESQGYEITQAMVDHIIASYFGV